MNLGSLVGHLLELLRSGERSSQPIDRATAEFFRRRGYLGSHDRRYIADHYFGIIRHRRFLEALLEQASADLPGGELLDKFPDRFVVLVLLYGLSSSPEPAVETIIPPALWKTSFPSIDLGLFTDWYRDHRSLAFLGPDELVRLGVRYSFQDWMVRLWSDRLVQEAGELLESMNLPAPVALRVNTLRCSVGECLERLKKEGVEAVPGRLAPHALLLRKRFSAQSTPAFRDGWFEIQDEGSQMVSLLADPAPGWRVIDACAGAGGKSLHLAAIMQNRGEILAIDPDRKKLAELGTRAVRSGVSIIRTAQSDAGDGVPSPAPADLVLVDAPCTGSGTIRRNPALKWRLNEQSPAEYHRKQVEILERCAQLVRPGGRLVYSTCSLFPQENEEVVRDFTAGNGKFRAVSFTGPGAAIVPGDQPGECTLYPHRHGTDGFFISLLLRNW
ncbi:MAG TPA: RsmB/NOP family class I SAM-dependent RNA methyltransferase [Bacteroidota bacterium]|nr:RsmB/NOP family class I SAM-dependent RNA methyltransferase [Bacteroidota bacterium]